VTDHNVVYDGSLPPEGLSISLLPGVEWSVYRQHVVAIGRVEALPRDSFGETTARMVRIFSAIEHQGGLSIASLPEYWRNHAEELGAFAVAGVDGFEIVNCAPKALGFPSNLRRQVIGLAESRDLMVVGASDNHGWGQVTCVWNVSRPGAQGFHTNRVFARPLALVQGDWRAWTAPITQPWFTLRGLSWSERASWLTWVVIILLYRALPRREGQSAGLGILARSVFRGRLAGSEYNLKATAYIASEVKRFGLQPAGDSGGFFQNVPLVKRQLDASASLAVDGAALRPWEDFVPRDPVVATRSFDGAQVVYA